MDCKLHPLKRPILVASATDKYLTPTYAFADPLNLPPGVVPRYGQDITHNVGRKAPKGQSVGTTEADLKPKMKRLLDIFAAGDKSGMAADLFAQFLSKRSSVTYFDNKSMTTAVLAHPNARHFLAAALGAPGSTGATPGRKRIHQALRDAGWDITKIVPPTDLGVPAFNTGRKTPFASFNTEDFANGLGLMINGVQYVYVLATHYDYDAKTRQYCIRLRYLFYDVFGLDDDDLREFGAESDGRFASAAAVGITAWWQLQHQFGYAPLVTRIVLEWSVTIPAV